MRDVRLIDFWERDCFSGKQWSALTPVGNLYARKVSGIVRDLRRATAEVRKPVRPSDPDPDLRISAEFLNVHLALPSVFWSVGLSADHRAWRRERPPDGTGPGPARLPGAGRTPSRNDGRRRAPKWRNSWNWLAGSTDNGKNMKRDAMAQFTEFAYEWQDQISQSLEGSACLAR